MQPIINYIKKNSITIFSILVMLLTFMILNKEFFTTKHVLLDDYYNTSNSDEQINTTKSPGK